MQAKNSLLEKIADKAAVIGIYGLGYVGLPLAIRFVEAGFKVIGFDIDQSKIDALSEGRKYIKHIDISPLNASKDLFTPTADFARTRDVDVLIACVPTPLDAHREPDMSFVMSTFEGFLPYVRPGQMISLESTTYPGTTEDDLAPLFLKKGLRIGEDVFLVYSPEREDPGNPNYSTRTIPKVCGGVTADCLEVGKALYEKVIDKVIPVSSARTAEMTKLLENIHRAVNIGLVNELKIVADRMAIDIHEVIEAAATKPFGFVPYYPGPGLGGHCIPIDPFYLTWKAREYGVNTRFIELAGEVNSSMPRWVVQKVAEGLNTQSKSVKGSRILILGIAYKKNVDDMRESPAVELMELLRDQGAHLAYSDPHVPTFPKMRQHRFELNSTPCTAETLSEYDCVVLATHHDDFDYDLILKHARLLIDTRGVYRGNSDNLIKA